MTARDPASGLDPPGFDHSRVVGRVAQVLWDQCCPAIRLDAEDVPHYEARARELIAAMREPEGTMLQYACEKHLPGRPMHDTTPPWPDERYRTEEECPRFVSRRNMWRKMIDAAIADGNRNGEDRADGLRAKHESGGAEGNRPHSGLTPSDKGLR